MLVARQGTFALPPNGTYGTPVEVRCTVSRQTSEGLVECYIHPGSQVGVLIEVNCETDFVARTDEFKGFVRDIAMHIAAASPMAISGDDLDEDMIAKEREIYRAQGIEEGKPAEIVEKIVEGRVAKYRKEVALLEQPFVKNPDVTVGDLLKEKISTLGENMGIKRFSRFQIGA